MNATSTGVAAKLESPRLTDEEIQRKLDDVPRLASLRSISSALRDLLDSEYSFTAQIAEIVRRDPSLTARLLRLVNSVFFGVSQKITNIEEAVFYLGLRQIRELAIATPVIEDFEKMEKDVGGLDWRLLWQQCIGAALLTREILSLGETLYDDDTDYLAGLLHKVGKIAMAAAFPAQFSLIHEKVYPNLSAIYQAERYVIGWDHARVGAYYLKKNNLKDELVEAIAHQNMPQRAGRYGATASAIQVAQHMLRGVGIRGIEKIDPSGVSSFEQTPGWRLLQGRSKSRSGLAMASLNHTLKRLPVTLNGMV